MAIGTPTYLGHNGHNASSSDLVVTLSGVIPTGAVAFCSVAIARSDSTNPAAPSSVSGGGVTWDLETSHQFDTAGGGRGSLFIYRAHASSPSGTTVTITPGYTCTMAAGVCYVTGAATGSNGASAILQEVSASTGPVSGGVDLATAAMSTLTDTTNNGFLMFTAGVSAVGLRTFTPDTSPAMTEVGSFDFGTGTGTSYVMQHAAYAIGISDSNPSFASRANSGVDSSGCVCYEIAAAGGLSITSVTPSSFDDGHTGIVIAGTGFGASQGSSTLKIGSQAQTVTAWSDTSITFTCVRDSGGSMGARQLVLTKG